MEKPSALLVGPFIGEFNWELYRFAPYIIHLKKLNPSNTLIVYTRPERFDLYGKYADILVPLNFMKGEKFYIQEGFGIQGFQIDKYDLLVSFFNRKYKKRYVIEDHIFADIITWRRKIKWQFPRDKMDYNFEPRKENYNLMEGFFDETSNVFVSVNDSDIRHSLNELGYDPIMYHWLVDIVKNNGNGFRISFVGCLMIVLRKCKFVVANVNSTVGRIALLLKKPVVSINEKMTHDAIHLLNPFNVPVINCKNIEEGVEIYEENYKTNNRL